MRLWFDALDWPRYREHEPDWADGYLAVVSGMDRQFQLWTYDRESRTTWRPRDDTRVSLAVTLR